MQETGLSEFSNPKNAKYSLSFWQNFFLTLFSATGLISMVADGPIAITVVSFVIVIAILFRISAKIKRK